MDTFQKINNDIDDIFSPTNYDTTYFINQYLNSHNIKTIKWGPGHSISNQVLYTFIKDVVFRAYAAGKNEYN